MSAQTFEEQSTGPLAGRAPRSCLPQDIQPGPNFPQPMDHPLPVHVHTISVEDVLRELDRFGSRIMAPAIEAQARHEGQVSLNVVLNGDVRRTEYSAAHWLAAGGLKYWLEGCAQNSLAFLSRSEIPALLAGDEATVESGIASCMFITHRELKTLKTWICEAWKVLLRFRALWPQHLIQRLRPAAGNFIHGRFRLPLLRGPMKSAYEAVKLAEPRLETAESRQGSEGETSTSNPRSPHVANPAEGKNAALGTSDVSSDSTSATLSGPKEPAAVSMAASGGEWVDVSADVDEAEWEFV